MIFKIFLHEQLPEYEAELLPLLEGLLVGVVGGGDEEVVDLVLAVGEADLGLVLDDVLDLVELAHAVEDVVGAGELLALAHGVALVRRGAALVVEAGRKNEISCFIHEKMKVSFLVQLRTPCVTAQ